MFKTRKKKRSKNILFHRLNTVNVVHRIKIYIKDRNYRI